MAVFFFEKIGVVFALVDLGLVVDWLLVVEAAVQDFVVLVD